MDYTIKETKEILIYLNKNKKVFKLYETKKVPIDQRENMISKTNEILNYLSNDKEALNLYKSR